MNDSLGYVDNYPEHIDQIQELETEITRLRALVAEKDEALTRFASPNNWGTAQDTLGRWRSLWLGTENPEMFARASLDKE